MIGQISATWEKRKHRNRIEANLPTMYRLCVICCTEQQLSNCCAGRPWLKSGAEFESNIRSKCSSKSNTHTFVGRFRSRYNRNYLFCVVTLIPENNLICSLTICQRFTQRDIHAQPVGMRRNGLMVARSCAVGVTWRIRLKIVP